MSIVINSSLDSGAALSEARNATPGRDRETAPASQVELAPSLADAQRAASAESVNEAASPPSAEEVVAAAADVQQSLDQFTSRALRIRVDDALQRPIVSVIDRETDELIRQIPSENIVALARFLREQQQSAVPEEALTGILLRSEV